MEKIIENRLAVIDNNSNRNSLANVIINEMINSEQPLLTDRNSDAAEYVYEFIVSLPLAKIVALDAVNAYIEVRKVLIDEFLSKYTKDANIASVFATEKDIVLSAFEGMGIEEMYDACFVTPQESADAFEFFINQELPNVLPDYQFDVEVTFNVIGTTDTRKVIEKIKRRIGSQAYRKWGAATITDIVAIGSATKCETNGKFAIHINGNATYNDATIATALHNRIGANAKKHHWNEITLTDIKVQ